MLDKEPKQFEIFQRFMGYLIIALIVIVYYFTSPFANYQIYVPIFIVFIFLISPKLSHWLEYKYGTKMRKNVYFLIDIVVVSTALAAVHLSLSVTFVMLFAIIYIALNNKISFMMASLSVLLGFVVFYTNVIFIFGFDEYFQQTSPELSVLAFVSIILFINIGNYYQNRRILAVEKQKNTYFNEMNRYIELSNQLSRYAPLQLWQAIMRGETEAKIEYKRKKITVFFSDIQGFTEL